MPHSNKLPFGTANDENDVNSSRMEAITQLESGDLKRALEWANVFTQDSDNIFDLTVAARVYLASGEHDRAENALQLAVDLEPANHRPFTDLALLNLHRREFGKSVQHLLSRLTLVPDDTECQLLLGIARFFNGESASGIRTLDQLLQSSPASESAWEWLRHFYVVVADTKNVIEISHRWLQACPESLSAKYMLKTVEGDDIPDPACMEHVAESFDRSAKYYDAIQGALDYKGPESLGLLLEKLYPAANRDKTILDAGCGSGLAATRLSPHASRLVGVDRSQKMLDVAGCTGCYDSLVRCDLFEHLKNNVATYDLIAAVDSFCYFGDLERLIPATLAALRPGGQAVFSLDPGQMWPDTWFLQPNGRFSHSPPYIIRVMGENGIPDGTIRRVKWRHDNGKANFALLVAIRRPESLPEKSPVG